MTDKSEIERQVRQAAADIFNLTISSVTRDTSPETVKNWDSVQHLNFVLALETILGIRLEPEDVDRMRSIGETIDMLCEKAG